jgi:O-phospho-L-seryl-tRNASec:L-selenocysteinyl-tRNA synthase
VLDTPDNPISVALTLCTLCTPEGATGKPDEAVSFFGSMLFSRCVSGTRAVPRGKRQEVGGVVFEGYGAHHDRRAAAAAAVAGESPAG